LRQQAGNFLWLLAGRLRLDPARRTNFLAVRSKNPKNFFAVGFSKRKKFFAVGFPNRKNFFVLTS